MTQESKTIYNPAKLQRTRQVASQFDLPGHLEVTEFSGKGNINQETFLVAAGPPGIRTEYLLQKINPNVFRIPRLVMQSMISCIEAQRKALELGVLRDDEQWETIRLIRTRDGKEYLEIDEEDGPACWRMMARMNDVLSYRRLWEIPDPGERLRVAEETGKGLALFGNLTAGMKAAELQSPLPGYRDTALYFDQLHSVMEGNRTLARAADYLPRDPLTRRCTESHCVVHLRDKEYRRRMADPQAIRMAATAVELQSFGLSLLQRLRSGRLSLSVIHGDTKLENFLFSARTGKVRSLVDLDTVMPHSWLADWGDMVRSLANTAGEKEHDIRKVDVDMDVFKAAARGFLGSARSVDLDETGMMVEAAQIMTLELGVRFLADFLRGDTYFKLKPADPWDLNKTRALVQFTLFEKFRNKAGPAAKCIEELLD